MAPATPATAPAARTAAVPESLPELIIRARALEEQGNPDARACWARLRTLAAAPGYTHPDDPAVGPLAELRADLLDDEADRAAEKDEFSVAAALHEEAAGLYDAAEAQGAAALSRAGALLSRAEIPAEGDGAEARAAALTAAHASIVRLQQETSGLTPYQEARLLRLRATALGMRLQASQSDEHAAAVRAEVDLLHAFATRHDIAGQVTGARLMRASMHALCGDLPAAVAEIDDLLDRLRADGPAWHLPHTLGLRGRFQLVLDDADAAHADLAEALQRAAEWPAEAMGTARLHGDLAEACLHLGRPEEALRHLTRSAELDLRHGSRTQAFCTYDNAARLSLDLGRVEDCIALLDSLLAEPDVTAGELDDRLVAQLRLTRARALHAGKDLKAATAEFVALAAESAGWDDDPGSHAMIATETAVLLGEAGDFGRAREAVEQALAVHAQAPRYEQLSDCLRELARLRAQQQGPDGIEGALAFLADAGGIADEARAAGYQARGRSLDSALAYEHGRVDAYAGAYEDSLAALDKALAVLGDPEPEPNTAGEWAECVRLAGAVEGLYLERPAPALTRVDAAVSRLIALGHTEDAEPLASLAARLREEE